MSTIVLPRRKYFGPALIRTEAYSNLSILSCSSLIIFISYLLFFNSSLISQPFWSFVCLIVAPALSWTFSTMALNRFIKQRSNERGEVIAYISFIVSSLYFLTALALPFVMFGFYLVYIYIW